MSAFSVVLCTYNRAETMPRTIGTVLSQTFEDFELVVVDDGSGDDTSGVVRAIDDQRIRYVHQPNSGLSAARNFGVANSSGRLVTFIDDDDEALPEWLASFAGALDPEAPSVACCGHVIVDAVGERIGGGNPRPLGPVFEDYTGLFLAGTFALDRRAFDAAGGFAPGVQASHHTEFALRLLPLCRQRKWQVRTIDLALIRHVIATTELRRERTPQKVLDGTTYILGHHHDQLSRSPTMLANYYATAGVAAAKLRDYHEARRWLELARQTEPRNWRHRARSVFARVPGLRNSVWRTPRVNGL